MTFFVFILIIHLHISLLSWYISSNFERISDLEIISWQQRVTQSSVSQPQNHWHLGSGFGQEEPLRSQCGHGGCLCQCIRGIVAWSVPARRVLHWARLSRPLFHPFAWSFVGISKEMWSWLPPLITGQTLGGVWVQGVHWGLAEVLTVGDYQLLTFFEAGKQVLPGRGICPGCCAHCLS